MHDITFRTRIFLCFLAVIVMTLVLPGLYVRHAIKTEGITETVNAAQREASLIAMQLGVAPGGLSSVPALLETTSQKLDIRVTYISAQGDVLAESSSAQLRLGELDNHADRQEIESAQKTGLGSSIRHSNTLDTDLVYVAVPFAGTDTLPEGFIRVAVPLDRVEARISSSENHWMLIIGFATLLALLLAYALSTRLERSLKEMIRVVESIATGPSGSRRRLHILPGKEFRRLAHAVNDMADRIEDQVRSIAEHKSQLKTILDVMNEGVLVIGEKGRIRLVNPALVRLFPQVQDAEGKLPVEAIPCAELQQALDDMLKAVPDKELLLTLELEPRPNTVLSVQLIRPQSPIHDVLAVAVFHDISEMARLMRVRKEFVANVSHELRTPLTAITGYAETLRDAKDMPAICTKFAETILRNARHMGTMVEDLLRLSRIESGAVPMDMQPIRAAGLLTDVICASQPQAAARNLNLVSCVEPETTIKADPHFIAQVFRNLLENACRYAPEHSDITVSCEKSLSAGGEQQALFTIQDTGPGIPEADTSRVFERFYRVEKHRSSPASTGLGLAICKHIVERHGGRIWAEQGPGGTFRFTLPLTAGSAENS